MELKRPQDRAPRPPARLILTTPEHLLAFGLGAGLSPVAPGTVGTVWGIPLFLALSALPLPYYLAAVALLFAAGVWLCGESARLLATPDNPGIVFDEVVGYLITATPLLALPGDPAMAWWLLAAFALFRFFDVLKPWPIRWLDRSVHGGFGIMVDDAVAGLFGAALLAIGVRLLG